MGGLKHNNGNITVSLWPPHRKRNSCVLSQPSSGSPHSGRHRKNLGLWRNFRQIWALTCSLNKCLPRLNRALAESLNPDKNFALAGAANIGHKLRSQSIRVWILFLLLIGYIILSSYRTFLNLSFLMCRKDIILSLWQDHRAQYSVLCIEITIHGQIPAEYQAPNRASLLVTVTFL